MHESIATKIASEGCSSICKASTSKQVANSTVKHKIKIINYKFLFRIFFFLLRSFLFCFDQTTSLLSRFESSWIRCLWHLAISEDENSMNV